MSNIEEEEEEKKEQQPHRDEELDGGTITVEKRVRKKKILKPPSPFKVLFHNDNYTSQEFVVFLFHSIFHHPIARAHEIMLNVHKKGTGIAGVYSFEIAEQRVYESMSLAKENDFPLMVTAEEV